MHLPLSCSFTHHFFNYIYVSGVNPRFWASPSTYWILPRHCCQPLVLNYNQVSIKKIVRNCHSFTIFQFVHPWPAIHHISSHRPNFSWRLPPTCVSINQVAMQKMVRNHHAFTTFLFVHSPFFQLFQCVRREPAILGIFSHIQNFAPLLLPPSCVKL